MDQEKNPQGGTPLSQNEEAPVKTQKNSLSDMVTQSLYREKEEAQEKEKIFQAEKEKQEEEMKRKQYERNPIDLLSRISHLIGYNIIAVLFLGFTFFLGGSALKEGSATSTENVLFLRGKATITLSTGEEFSGKQENNILFGGEEISLITGKAEVHFSDETRIRLEEGAKIKVVQISPDPIIQHISGKIWVFGQKNPEIRYQNAAFFARGTSALFEKFDTVLSVATLRHPLLAEVWSPKNLKHASFILPTKHKISFSLENIPESIADIHYSKLKKELHLSAIEPDEWTSENVLEDRREAEIILSDFLRNRRMIFFSGFFHDLREKLIVFESKKEEIKRKDEESKKQFLIEEYILGISAHDIKLANISDDDLDTTLYYATFISNPDGRLLNKVMDIIQEFRKRKDVPHRERIIAQTILSLYEEALLQNDDQMVQKILQEQVAHWKKENVKDEETKRLLEIYREIIAVIFQEKVQMVTPELFALATELDNIALSAEEKESENVFIAALEVIQRNFATANTFLEKGDLSVANSILRQNRLLLKGQTPSQKFVLTYRDYTKRQEDLESKLDVFREFGVMSDANVEVILQERKKAEGVIANIQNAEGFGIASVSEENATGNDVYLEEEVKKTEAEQIREDFSGIGYVIISPVTTARSDDGAVLIAEAVLPNGDSFSAEYFVDSKVVRNVDIPTEDIYLESEISLAELPVAIETIRNTSRYDPTSIRLARDNLKDALPSQEEDPLAKVDPIVIDVTRRQAQKEFAKHDYEVNLLDIVMTSETTLAVKNISMPFLGSNTVSLVIEKATQGKAVLKNIFIEPYHVSVPQTDIEHLLETTEKAFNDFLAREELRGQTEWVLLDAGVTISSEDVRITDKGITFQSGKYYSWVLSGTADPEEQIFSLISRDNREFLRDIHFDDLRETLRLELMKTNPEILSEQ